MNNNNPCGEDFPHSEAWLAEQIFSHLRDFNTEPLSDKENIKLNNSQGQKIQEKNEKGILNITENKEPQSHKEIQFKIEHQDSINGNIDGSQNFPNSEKKNTEELACQDPNLYSHFDPSMIAKTELQIIECANCNCIFDVGSFPQHVCDYDENSNLILPEPMEQTVLIPQSDPIEPPCIRLLRENQIRIRRFLKDELKYDLNATNSNSKKLDGPHECTLCERKFVHASGLSRHMEKHALDLIPTSSAGNANNVFPPINSLKVVIKCVNCGRIFFEADTAFKHLCAHFGNTIEAEKEFQSIAEFPYENYLDEALNFLKIEFKDFDNKPIAHLKMVISSCVLQCEFCDFQFSEVLYLFLHSACHRPHRPFECFACEIHVSTAKEIFTHWQAECVFAREHLKRGSSLQKYYVCNVCENKFNSLEQLHEHRYTAYHFFPRLDKKRGMLILPCEYCDLVFESAEEIVNHFEEKHYKKNKRDPAAKYRQYLCDVCGKTYTQSSHLWQHLRFHKGVKPFACKEPGCSRRFTIRPDLNDHIRKCHTGERPYHCLVCGRRFLTGSVFYQHRLIHRGERRYGCDECGKRFYRADALKNHHRIHTGEKPYGCLFCTKTFRQRGDRDKHIRARHSSLDANARLMMQLQKMQLEAAARNNGSLSISNEDVLMLGNIPFPKSMFQPILNDIDACQG